MQLVALDKIREEVKDPASKEGRKSSLSMYEQGLKADLEQRVNWREEDCYA